MYPPLPREIRHMSILADCDKTRRIGWTMAFRASDTVLKILIKVKILSGIKQLSALKIRAYMPVREGHNRNITRKTCSRHIEAIDT